MTSCASTLPLYRVPLENIRYSFRVAISNIKAGSSVKSFVNVGFVDLFSGSGGGGGVKLENMTILGYIADFCLGSLSVLSIVTCYFLTKYCNVLGFTKKFPYFPYCFGCD